NGMITVEAKYAGRKGQCPECLAEFTIPRTEAAPVPVSGSVARPTGETKSPSGTGRADPSSSGSKRGPGSGTGSVARPTPAPAQTPTQDRRRAQRVQVLDGRVAYAVDSFPGENQPPV